MTDRGQSGGFEEPTQRMPDSSDPDEQHETRRMPTPSNRPTSSPPTQRIAVPPDQRARWIGVAGIALVVVSLLAAGYAGYKTNERADDVIASGRVTPDGGGLTFDNGGRIAIPPGALSTTTTITVRRVRIDRRVQLDREDGPPITYERGELAAYAFEPSDQTFLKDITIELPAPKGGALLIARGNTLRVIPAERREDTIVITTQQLSFG
jgi:hypothetical protein